MTDGAERPRTVAVHSVLRGGTVDGPGVRTVVFLQGCPLACGYCHNRDTWAAGGKLYAVADLVGLCARDKAFFGRRGGVTLSGGEPLLQGAATAALAGALQAEGIHVCLDTAGSIVDAHTDAILERTDLVLLDVKHADPDRFRALTGGSLATTLAFLARIRAHGTPYWVRHVVVEGWTDTEAEIDAMLALVPDAARVELLGYHGRGAEKWKKLGIPYPFDGMPDFDPDRLDALRARIPPSQR